MEDLISRIIEKYGTEIEVLRAGGWIAVRAFLQPARSKNWQKMEREVSPIGEIPGGQYVFIGPAETVQETDMLRLDGRQYLIRTLDTVYYANTPVYCWGLCSRKGEEDTWGQ